MAPDDADDLVPFLDVRAIKQRPVVAVLTALGVGYVVARLVSHGER